MRVCEESVWVWKGFVWGKCLCICENCVFLTEKECVCLWKVSVCVFVCMKHKLQILTRSFTHTLKINIHTYIHTYTEREKERETHIFRTLTHKHFSHVNTLCKHLHLIYIQTHTHTHTHTDFSYTCTSCCCCCSNQIISANEPIRNDLNNNTTQNFITQFSTKLITPS